MKQLTHTQALKAALKEAPEEYRDIIKELFKMRKNQSQLKNLLKSNDNNK